MVYDARTDVQGLAGLVLVAPAILAAPLGRWGSAPPGDGQGGPGSPCSPAASTASPDSADSGAGPGPGHDAGALDGAAAPAWRARLRAAARVAAAVGVAALAGLARGALWLLGPLLVLALRGAVRSRAFWERGLASAWCGLGARPPG